MHSRKRPLPTDIVISSPSLPPAARRIFISSAYSSSFTAKKAHKAHHSCINALAVSSDGRWLASGGDDLRVLVHDVSTDVAAEPKGCYRGARSNIFTLDFSCNGAKIFSAGNDAAVMCFDLESSSSAFPIPLDNGVPPANAWLDHDDSVMGLSCHPSNPALLLSASSDGTLRLFDVRQPGSVGLIADQFAFDDVVHHPVTPDVFAYAAEGGHLGLIDGRMAWSDASKERASGPNGGLVVKIASDLAVQQFDATLLRRSSPDKPLQSAHPTVSSVVFSPTGSLLCATLSGYLPTLYELSSPAPLATFSSPPPPLAPSDKTASPLSFPQGYRNTCTMKHGSFGGGSGASAGRGLFYAGGSDDFKAYVWEVPDVETLRRRREEKPKEELSGIGFRSRSHPDKVTLPASISTPSAILTGHRSIVNTALFDPNLPRIWTSGVEKTIVQHSASSQPSLVPSPSPPGSSSAPSSTAAGPRSSSSNASTLTSAPPSSDLSWRFTPRIPRSHLSHPGLSGPSDPGLDSRLQPGESPAQREQRLRGEDLEVLEYFDGLVEMEGEETLWDEEGRRFGGDDSEEEDDDEGGGTDSGEESEETREFMRALRRRIREDEGDDDEEEERNLGEGEGGSTRRILRAIYALEEEEGDSSDAPGGTDDSFGDEEAE
ncbi:hypothetical protein JCM8547_007625 [Rhodosporidiobolus lusitaniae]